MTNRNIQFHAIHGDNIKLLHNNTTAKRTDSFCKGICFSNRTIEIREKIYIRLVHKSVQWTGFLRLGVTTCDPNNHRSSILPRHACPDLTCRPGYWAKCVPENCFDSLTKTTYFYVDDTGELFLNTPSGEISLLTGISVREQLWALLDIYGNCISVEFVDINTQQSNPIHGLCPNVNITNTTTKYFKRISNDLTPLKFLPLFSSSISLCSSPSNGLSNQTTALRNNRSRTDGLVYFSEPLQINSAILIQILTVITSGESHPQATTVLRSNQVLQRIQFGLTNCDTLDLCRSGDLPLDIEQINNRSECWIIDDFKLNDRDRINCDDEFLFTFDSNGVIKYSHNGSELKDFIHVDASLTYYPFLVLKGDVTSVRCLGYIRQLAKNSPLITTSNTTCVVAPSTSNTLVNVEDSNKEIFSSLHGDCCICFNYLRDTVLIPCGHICLCYSCATELNDRGSKQCPICRSSITLINKIYLA